MKIWRFRSVKEVTDFGEDKINNSFTATENNHKIYQQNNR